MSKELDYLDKILNYQPLTLVERTIIECIKEKIQRLEVIDNVNPSDVLEWLENKCYVESPQDEKFEECCKTIKQALIKAQEQEKENELLKEIIKSLFDRGCPLHQYIDKDFGLAIEVDKECSTMILGEYKGVNLDKYLKEVINNE